MVESEDTFVKIPCELDLDRDGRLSPGSVVLTEGGDLTIQFEEGVVSPHTDLFESWKTIEGSDDRGFDVTVENAITTQQRNFSLTEISTTSVHIFRNEDFVPDREEEVVIDFDLLCFLPEVPPRNQVDPDSREILSKLSEGGRPSIDIPKEFEIHYIGADDYDVSGVPLTDTTDRRDFIKNRQQPIRTAKIRTRLQIDGSLTHQLEVAEGIVLKIIELSQLVQEVTPRHVRGRVVSVDGTMIEDIDAYCEILESGSSANAGGCFSQFPDKVLWANFHEYIEQAYPNYTSRIRHDLRLQQVLGYYIDARDPGRPVEGKMLSVCSAIELFALWHARKDGISTKTAQKIKHLVDKLDVETEDLAKRVVPDLDALATPEYFWRRERNYVSHGDPDIDSGDIVNTYEATLVLLKRIIRNQLLGAENDSFEKFYSMNPRPSIKFDD